MSGGIKRDTGQLRQSENRGRQNLTTRKYAPHTASHAKTMNHASASVAAAPAPAPSAHTAFLLSHISSSAPHPTHTQTVQACTRFSWTAGGSVGSSGLPVNMQSGPSAPSIASLSGSGSSGTPLLRAPGLKIVFHWPVPASTSVAAEMRRWEGILSGGEGGIDPLGMIDSAVAVGGSKPAGSLPSSAAHSPAVKGLAGPGATAASAAAQAAAAAALPSLPAPALSTGARWAVVVENCFLLPRAGAPASSAPGAGPAATAAAASKDQKLFRVRASFGGSLGPPSSWLLTHNLVLEGSAAMDRWIDGLAPASGTVGGSMQSAAASSSSAATSTSASAVGSDGTASGAPSLLQIRSQVSFSGDEWILGGGDYIVRIATLKEGSKQRSVIVMEIESGACVSPAPDNLKPLYELASRLGVPPSAQLHQVQDLTWKALAMGDFGLSLTNYTLAHCALQYLFLVTSLRDTAAATAQAP